MIIQGKRKRKRFVLLFLIVLVIALYQFNYIEKVLYPYPYKPIVEKYAAAYGVDPLLVISVIREESHFIPLSSSHKGAVGLMQLMPETAEEIAVWLKEDYAQIDLEKPEDNIRYGTWYLSTLQKQFSGNSILILAAYNAGSGRVNSWLQNSARDLNTYQIEEIPFKETREYVVKVLRSYGKYAELYGE